MRLEPAPDAASTNYLDTSVNNIPQQKVDQATTSIVGTPTSSDLISNPNPTSEVIVKQKAIETGYDFELESPNHPSSNSSFSKQILKGKTLQFQTKWFEKHPWLHFCPKRYILLCFFCAKAEKLSLLSLIKRKEEAFITIGFANWKKALEKFSDHEKSECHLHAVEQLHHLQEEKSICDKLSKQVEDQRTLARVSFLKVISSIKFLARQGLALRGHNPEEGNFQQLMCLREEDYPALSEWRKRKVNFTSPKCQNEILLHFSHQILRNIATTIKEESKIFAIIADGTQDCSGLEQLSICIRHVNKSMDVREDFVGLYQPPDTTGLTLSTVIKDTLMRLGLPVSDLRGQTYGGASNMSGQYQGCQARLKAEQPLALHFRCGAHCVNLVVQHLMNIVPVVRDAIHYVHELGVMFSRSGKAKMKFSEIATTANSSTQIIKPLCPTRWICRAKTITAVLNQYTSVLETLEEISKGSFTTDMIVKANGLSEQFRKGNTILVLHMAVVILRRLEILNTLMQSVNSTIEGTVKAVEVEKIEIKRLRSACEFKKIFEQAKIEVGEMNLNLITTPKTRTASKRYTGPADHYVATDAEEYFRKLFFELLDNAYNQLQDRFNIDNNSDLATYVKLEKILLLGVVNKSEEQVVENYPELTVQNLSIQLQMFKNQYNYCNISEAKEVFDNMHSEVRLLFGQVEMLLRLLLVCPATSCQAERSFSALRRLKTWLRSTMTQERLNSVIVCHIHQSLLDETDVKKIAYDFVNQAQVRKNCFGETKF